MKARVMRVMDLSKFVSFLEPCGYGIYLFIDLFFKSCFKTYISGETSDGAFFDEIPLYSGTSIQRRAKGLKKDVRYNEVSLYRGSLSYISLLLGRRMLFVIPRPSLY